MNIIIITKTGLYNVASIDTIIHTVHLDLGDITFLAGRYTLITNIINTGI